MNKLSGRRQKVLLFGIPSVLLLKIYASGIYKQLTPRKYDSQANKTILIIGGNDGIGLETVKYMLKDRANVIIASRNVQKSNDIIQKMTKEEKGKIEFMKIDLSDLNSVKDFIENFKQRNQQIDTLINNAGVYFPKGNSAQGYEFLFATNYLGPFYLTVALLPYIKASSESRIINVSSRAHFRCPKNFSFDDPVYDGYFQKEQVKISNSVRYPISKLSNILFTRQLQKHLEREGSQIKVYTLHPGVVRTGLFQQLYESFWSASLLTLIYPLIWLLLKNPYQGSLTTTYLACAPNDKLVKGGYYTDITLSSTSKEAEDHHSQKALWNKTIDLLNREGLNLAVKPF